MSTFEASASARPFVISGIALAMPPLPVRRADARAGAPEPRLEREGGRVERRGRTERHVLVRAVQLRARSPRPATAWPTASFEAADALPEVSTATTT